MNNEFNNSEVYEAVETYPPDVSYEKLKHTANSYSFLYRIWVDIIFCLTFIDYWLGVTIYPCLVVCVILFTPYWYLVLLYVFWIYYDRETPHNGGRTLNCWKNCFTSKYVRAYHPVGLVKTADLSPDKNYILAVFPHGLLCAHGSVNFVHDTVALRKFYPGVEFYAATLNFNFYSPICRDLKLFKNAIAVSEKSLISVLTLKPGTACMIVVGGAAEAHYVDTIEYKLVVKNRKGFVRVALKTGSSLVPVFGYGENRLYDVLKINWLTKIQYYLYKLTGIAQVIPLGRFFGPIRTLFIPKCEPLITVVGRPIDLPKIENPTKEQIDYYHQKFMDEMYVLFENFKRKYDPAGNDAKLIYG